MELSPHEFTLLPGSSFHSYEPESHPWDLTWYYAGHEKEKALSKFFCLLSKLLPWWRKKDGLWLSVPHLSCCVSFLPSPVASETWTGLTETQSQLLWNNNPWHFEEEERFWGVSLCGTKSTETQVENLWMVAIYVLATEFILIPFFESPLSFHLYWHQKPRSGGGERKDCLDESAVTSRRKAITQQKRPLVSVGL